MSGTWPHLDPDERLDRQLNWSKNLVSGETVVSSVFTVESGTVEITSQSNSDTITTVWLHGGEIGETCLVNNHVTMSSGRERDWSMKIKIKAK